jgi:uncharacterized membrane protein
MHHRDFFERLDEKKVAAAIHRAERGSSAQVRVFISHHHNDDALEAAKSHFHLLGMGKTKHRNAVLIFFAPESRKFAIYGDVGIDQRAGGEFWHAVRDEIVPHLKAGEFTTAIEHAVDRVAGKLAEHFPLTGKRKKEMGDEIGHD